MTMSETEATAEVNTCEDDDRTAAIPEFLEWLEKHPLFVEKGRQFHRFGR